MERKFLKNNLFLVILFLASLIVRFWKLDLFPISIIHDEINYVLNAKSLWNTGENIPWTASALFSWGEKNFDVVIAELPSILTSPWIGPLPLNHLNVRAPYALISSFSVVLLYLIAKELFKKEQIARLAGLIFAFNPWSIHFGRTALEVNFATFFFLLGTYFILLYNSWRIFWAFPAFLASFLSYLGAKLHFFPLILILLVWKYKTTGKKADKYPFFLFGLLAFLTVLVYFLTLNYQPTGKRAGELIFFNQEWASEIVNKERRQAIPNKGLNFFSNKATVILQRIGDVYLLAFSPVGLFAKGETVSVYSLWQHGQFYYLDFLLIFFGLLYVFAKYRKVFWLLVSIIASAPWVSSIDLVEKTFAVRAYPMFPFLALLAGIGFLYIKEQFPFGKYIVSVAAGLYILLILNFLNLYFFRYPIYSAERWFFSERLIAHYISLAEEAEDIDKIYIVTKENPKWVFEEYLFYSGNYNDKASIQRMNKRIRERNFSWKKAVFLDKCPQDIGKKDVLILDRRICPRDEQGKHGIVDLKDAGTVLIIENDLLCKNLPLQRYSRVTDMKNLYIERQERTIFCKNWISQF